MGANHAGTRKRQKAKNTKKIAATIAKKEQERTATGAVAETK